ncbi:hypothetical protein GCM10022247_35040 [Allokutzneria multivorans]|uniref:DUF1376 domain-containing protein n=1 Tax=Allokutzneria multivorans TaxID=1142134 RepID=A0ABP7SD03_9PSEU
MPFFPFLDEHYGSPQYELLPAKAFKLHMMTCLWSAKIGTDGAITSKMLRRVSGLKKSELDKLVGILTSEEFQLWETTDDGYQIRDWPPMAMQAHIEHKREVDRLRQRKWRSKRRAEQAEDTAATEGNAAPAHTESDERPRHQPAEAPDPAEADTEPPAARAEENAATVTHLDEHLRRRPAEDEHQAAPSEHDQQPFDVTRESRGPDHTSPLQTNPDHPTAHQSTPEQSRTTTTTRRTTPPPPRSTPERASPAERDQAELLCQRLAQAVRGNGARAKVTHAWRDHARRLLTADNRHLEFETVVNVLDWAARHDFWHARILSMPKFHQHFDTLLLQYRAEHNRPNRAAQRGTSADSMEAKIAWLLSGGTRVEADPDVLEATVVYGALP